MGKLEVRNRRLRFRKLICGGLILILYSGWFFPGNAFGASEFRDIKNSDWFRLYVMELAEEGIISGYPDGTFRPGNQVTTGQFLAMVIQTGERLEVIEEKDAEAEPKGEDQNHWARSFYDRALESELLFNDELPTSSLDRPISREWMAVIASRMLPKSNELAVGGKGNREAAGEERTVEYDVILDRISDVEEMSEHSFEIITAYQKGLLSGYPDGTFRPEGYLTRAEAATVIHKLKGLWDAAGTGESADEVEVSDEKVSDTKETCGYDDKPSDMAKGTVMFWYQRGTDPEEMRRWMETYSPELSESLYESFADFADRVEAPENQGLQGLRKEYVGDHPVLMEAVGDKIRVYVKPQGTETRFWGVSPGEISEEFF